MSLLRILCLIMISLSFTFCTKNKLQKKQANTNKEQAAKNFKLTCPGDGGGCEETEISVTNISDKTYSNLIIICTDKDNPDASDKDPYHNWPFSLGPNETKCMEAVSHCLRKHHADKDLGDYYTLILLSSDNDPVWKLGNNCEKDKED